MILVGVLVLVRDNDNKDDGVVVEERFEIGARLALTPLRFLLSGLGRVEGIAWRASKMGIVEWSCKFSLQERADYQTPYGTRCGCTQYGVSSM